MIMWLLKQYYLKDIKRNFGSRGMIISDIIYNFDVEKGQLPIYKRPSVLYDKDPFTLNLGWKNGDKKIIKLWNKIINPIVCTDEPSNTKDVDKYLKFYEFWKSIVGLSEKALDMEKDKEIEQLKAEIEALNITLNENDIHSHHIAYECLQYREELDKFKELAKQIMEFYPSCPKSVYLIAKQLLKINDDEKEN